MYFIHSKKRHSRDGFQVALNISVKKNKKELLTEEKREEGIPSHLCLVEWDQLCFWPL